MKHDIFKNTFFPSTIIEWNKLDWKIKNSESIETFEKRVLSFIKPSLNSTFNCHNLKGIKLPSRLRLDLSHIVATSSHYLPNLSNYLEERLALLNTIKNMDMSVLQQSDLDARRFDEPLFIIRTSFVHHVPKCMSCHKANVMINRFIFGNKMTHTSELALLLKCH